MRTRTNPGRIVLAANNGEIGGGEVMLLNTAAALESLGLDVTIIGPEAPAGLVGTAESHGYTTVALPATNRFQYMVSLARWRLRHLTIPLWCHGLVPSLATAGLGPRLVHLHMLPLGAHRHAVRFARWRASRVLVPSRIVAEHVPGATVFENWTENIEPVHDRDRTEGSASVGYLGRLTRDKGVDVLARAMAYVSSDGGVHLILAGETRFGGPGEDDAMDEALAEVRASTDMLGWVERDHFFSQVDLAVFPSIAPESFGLVAAEAMAAGVPFVISDAGALPEVAGPGHPWIARRGDAADLARVISCALRDIARGDEVRAHSARERWERRYSPLAGRARVAALLRELPESRRGRREERAR